MNDLELLTTVNFGGLDCNFYSSEILNDIFVTREQIGTALEYSNPYTAIAKIHKRHKERLDKFSFVTRLEASDGKKYMTYLYNCKGIMEICRWSKQNNVNEFMDFCWDVIHNLYFKKGN